jgi:hypothetical protein
MPAPPLVNTFEGGTDGVTVSAANSGGSSGDAFQVVDGTGATFAAAAAMHESLGWRAVDPSVNQRCQWTGLGSLTSNVYARFYMRMSTAVTTNAMQPFKFRNSAVSNTAGLFIQLTTGFMSAMLAAGTEIAASVGSVQVPINQYVRVELRVLPSTTVGEVEWKWWATPDSVGAPTDTVAVTGQVLGNNIDQAIFGLSTNPATPFTIDLDDFAVSTTDWIGPAVARASWPNRSAPILAGP